MPKDKNSQIVVPILGMHRSGTSMLTHMLNIMGVKLGEPLQPPHSDNPKGFWENRFFQAVNMEVLNTVGCDMNGLDSLEVLENTCGNIKRAQFHQTITSQIEQYLRNSFQNTHWGWKDPRTVITWPYWEHVLQQLGNFDIRPIVLLRHPDSCAHSFIKRGDFTERGVPDDLPIDDYLAGLWNVYYALIESYISPDALVLLQEDLLVPESAIEEMERCAEYLGLNTVGIGPAIATVDVNLVSHKKTNRDVFTNHQAKSIYNTFRDRAEKQRRAFSRKTREGMSVTIPDGGDSDSYCIYIVSPENYIHSHAFDEHALSLHYAFRELGYIAQIVRYPWEIYGTPIVLGPNLLPHVKDIRLPQNSILYNLEQIVEGSSWIKPGYIDLLRQYQVWDYSQKNIDALESLGVHNTRLCRVGYVPELTNIQRVTDSKKDIDVLFYGSLNKRRAAILEQLKMKGLTVRAVFGVYGNRRDQLVARARIVLNIHFYESKVMEIIRLAYLMSNNVFIVSERGKDRSMERPFEKGIVLADYNSLVERCVQYIKNSSERESIAACGFETFNKYKQTEYLRNALDLD